MIGSPKGTTGDWPLRLSSLQDLRWNRAAYSILRVGGWQVANCYLFDGLGSPSYWNSFGERLL